MIGAIILGIVAGFIARALMPGRDPMGFVATIALGLAGSLVGYFIFRAIGIGDDDKFDLGGLIGAIIGAMIILGVWRKVSGGPGAHRGAGRAGMAH
ncbi:GlsB/YeaQ/YmgE family stress response membrane protein [Conexibacter sp. SYSU D00693]|uniref:GlsB/YeaQ/YmgE family stress response membrane protein n=1 Tax=Conexibacter sp. SYSU D00693 TaxID=2812560 RepID=UPI00196B31F2|nr:GlsB/YeaQ/YmgE family stress response membrane protein [Conexibacter sp. SYSU D00693]